MTKMFGLGLATAIFVDATIVRIVLVPAAMELIGDANWWIPAWLDHIPPAIEIPTQLTDELLPQTLESVPASRHALDIDCV